MSTAQSINALSSAGGDAIMHMDFDQHLLGRTTEDARIAARAYRNKTAPEFKGN